MLELNDRLVGHYTAYITDRGGMHRVGQLQEIGAIKCNRIRDDRSQATVAITALRATRQAELLNKIEPLRHELVIYRGQTRIWEGPITRLAFSKSSVEVHAEDCLYYLYRTVMRAGYSSAHPTVEAATARIVRIVTAELARKEALSPPVNVVPHIVRHAFPNEARTAAVTKPYETTVFDHLDSLAGRGGLDYTMVGRSLHLWDTSRAIGQTPRTTENDYLGEMVVTYYGAELVTHSYVTDGQDGVGTAIVPDYDYYYGDIEVVDGAFGEADEEGTAVDPAILQSQAQRNLAGAYPVPAQVRVPDSSSINMRGVLTPDMLVPGVHIPMLATLSVRTFSQTQKLHSVTFSEGPTGEMVSVVMVPAATADADEDEDE